MAGVSKVVDHKSLAKQLFCQMADFVYKSKKNEPIKPW